MPMGLLSRTKQFSPAMLPNLQLWIDASTITGLVNGDPVITWGDLSGNGRDCTQATAAKRPTFQTNIQNGLPIVRFDGVDDNLIHTLNIAVVPLTAFAVARKSGGAAGFQDLLYCNIPALLARSSTNNNWAAYPSAVADSGQSIEGVFRAFSSTYRAATDIDLTTDGITVNRTNGTSVYVNATSLTIGSLNSSGEFFSGDLCELLCYNVALTVDQRKQVERYLGQKWGVQMA